MNHNILSTYTHAISILCSLGLFLAGYIFYTSSLIEPFYTAEFFLNSWQIGIAQSAVPLGAIIGAILAGRLADILGRNRVLAWNFLAITLFGIINAFAYNFSSLFCARLLNGFLAGTLYPLCATYLIEMTLPKSHARKAAILMFINCLAAPVGCIVALGLSYICDKTLLWRLIAAAHAIPALIAFIWTKQLPESPAWLAVRPCPKSIPLTNLMSGIKLLFSPTYRNITICLIATWFLMDIAYYGINFFIPYLLQAMQIQSVTSGTSDLLSYAAMRETLIINIFFMLGALAAIAVINRVSLITLQKYGFFCSGLSLLLLAIYFQTNTQHSYIIILLFIIFNFAINIGPDVTTYLLSATSYPVEIRASGHGLIAGFAKFGSFLGVLFLPRIQDLWGYQTVILLLSIFLFIAYLYTIRYAQVISNEHKTKEVLLNYETT